MHARATRAAPLAAALSLLLGAQSVLATTWLPAVEHGASLDAAFGIPGAIAMVGTSTVGVVYQGLASGNERVYFRRSTDGGATWGSALGISPSSQPAREPALVAKGSIFDMVWGQDPTGTSTAYRVYYGRSLDGGQSWVNIKYLSPADENAYAPRVARDAAGRVVVTWVGDKDGVGTKIFVRVSTDGGLNFNARRSLDSTAQPWSYASVGIGDNGKIHVAFNDSGSVRYRRSNDDGATWTPAETLATGIQYIYPPAVAVAGRTLLVGYTKENNSTFERWVAYRRSTDNGANFEPQVLLTTQGGKDANLLIFSVRAGTWRALYARCPDTDPCSGPERELVLRTSTDGADTWSASELVPTGHDFVEPIGVDGRAKVIVGWFFEDPFSSALGVFTRREQ